MLQTILKPQVVSVESLERAQRAKSQTPNELPPMPLQATKAGDLEADLRNKLKVNDKQRDPGIENFSLEIEYGRKIHFHWFL